MTGTLPDIAPRFPCASAHRGQKRVSGEDFIQHSAEFGIAAHWLYKTDGRRNELDQQLHWFRQLLELQQAPEDRAVTRQLVEAGRLLDLPLYDHVILAGDRFFSFATGGLL